MRRVAISTNVKERLDFSCGLLDGEGRLVVNAPHIPVHLGALGDCVRRVAATLELGPGDVAVTNHPAFGGSHLPDVTVITPVFGEASGDDAPASAATARRAPLGYLATRAHHAELGGTRPGSMPPAATSLAEEGVVIVPRHLVRAGRAEWDAIRRLLAEGPYPSRAVDENLADLEAAVAANHRGATALLGLERRYGIATTRRFMRRLAATARRALDAVIASVGEGRYTAEERLDDGTPLAVAIDVWAGGVRFDFSGSGPVHPGNLNATPSIVRSVVLYTLRTLSGTDIPLNEGLLRDVEIRIPEGILDPP